LNVKKAEIAAKEVKKLNNDVKIITLLFSPIDVQENKNLD